MNSLRLNVNWSGHTDRGRVRKNNEDSFLGLSLDTQEIRYLGKIGEATINTDYVFAVSDGMGGAMAGEFASRIAVEKITKMLPSYLIRIAHSKIQEQEKESLAHQLLVELFEEIHRALLFLGASYDECNGMGTTLTLCWLRPERLYFAHIGDSRLYRLPPTGGMRPLSKLASSDKEQGVDGASTGATELFASEVEFGKKSIQQLSEDDTHVGWLFRQGKINEREAKNHPRRNFLQKALGADHQFVTPQVGSVNYNAGDRFLLCTDGVTDGIFDDQLFDILTTPTNKTFAQHLVEEAVLRSGRDNATAMVVEIH